MLAAMRGHLSEAVKHALSGADLHQRDATGRTALELAVEAEKRDTALALLLIATAKFTKPLPSPLPVPLLQRLQGWLGQAGAEKENAMGVLLQQYQGHLARGPALPADAPPQIAAAVVEMLAWAARHGLCALIDRLVEVLTQHAGGALPLPLVACARSSGGLTVLHALVMCGKGAAVTALLAALPPHAAASLRECRDLRGRSAAQVHGQQLVSGSQQWA